MAGQAAHSPPTRAARRRASLFGLLLFAAFSCKGTTSGTPFTSAGGHGGDSAAHADSGRPPSDAASPDAGSRVPFADVAPVVYVAKVKNLLVALPPTEAEVQRVEKDPSQLKALIGEWMKLPQYSGKLLRFFELAFQQTQINVTDFDDQVYPDRLAVNFTTTPQLVLNAQESFARTMLDLTSRGQPLTAAVTTRQFMLTTALKELYAFLDVREIDNDGNVTDHFRQDNPKLQISVTAKAPIPIAETLDPSHANYMRWYNPDLATANTDVPGCNVDPYVFAANAHLLHYLLYGTIDRHKTDAGMSCPIVRGSPEAPQLQSSDFSDWQLVSIRAPKAGEATTKFYDLTALRSAKELVLNIPRVGFFSTPAFFANWPTNLSNQARVTLNQTLIVSLGREVDGLDTTTLPDDPPGLDAAHGSNAECYFCHRYLDPLRSIFSATYSWNYHNQLDTTWSEQKGLFAFQGVSSELSDIADFANQLGQHPKLAEAWVQKLCYYADSAACDEDDPEFQRVVQVFKDSSFRFDRLIEELFSSPLITYARATQTAEQRGEVIAVARRDHLCSALSERLGLPDVCFTSAGNVIKAKGKIGQIAPGLPSDGYGRGAIAPTLPNQATLFYSAAVENICATLASQVVDPPAAKRVDGAKLWTGKQSSAAIDDFVAIIMGLVASDPRADKAKAALTQHFERAMQQGANASVALRSTFITACSAPSAVSIGL